ncbi:MAG: FHA domain-containing protein, partial [Vicinamibacteria bacterium]
MKRLVIKQGEQIFRREVGATSLTVGRDPTCELHFDDPSLSRRHGTFEPTATGVRFVDLQSRNGSWVNFKKVKEADLEPGDTVRMGSLLITYAYEPPPAPSPPPAPVEDPADDTATVIGSAKAEAVKEKDVDSTVLLSRKPE